MDDKILEWHKDRLTGIGSSDAPVIMGVSPWSTILKLYEEKISTEIKEQTENYAMQVGNRLEPMVRSLFESKMGCEFPAANVKREDISWVRASIDGRNQEKRESIEIKFMGKQDYEGVKMGFAPEKYIPQLQHILMATDDFKIYLLAYPHEGRNDKVLDINKLAILEVIPDTAYIEKLFLAEDAFWKCVQNRTPPEPGQNDYVPLTGFSREVELYKNLCSEVQRLETKRDHYKELFIEAARASGNKRLLCGGLKIAETTRVGSVDYAKIPELANVNLESYRKKPSVFWTVK